MIYNSKIQNSFLFCESVYLRSDEVNKINIAFSDFIKSDFHDMTQLKLIEKYIKKEFNMNASIRVNSDEYNLFFGMRIYPSKQELNDMAIAIIKNDESVKFRKCINVVIEIDKKMLNKKRFNLTANHLTAMLLHEIGHKVSFNKFRDMYNNLVSTERSALASSLIIGMASGSVLVSFVILGLLYFYCNQLENEFSNKIEIEADDLAVSYGYGESLHDFLTMIAIEFGDVPKNVKENQDTLINRYLKWSFENFKHLGIRRKSILNSLKAELNSKDNTDYEKEVIEDQIKKIERRF